MVSTAEKTLKRMLRTRGALAAAVTTGGVAAYIVAKDLVSAAVTTISIPPEYLGDYTWFAYFGYGFLASVVPFLVGFFLSLWVVAPVAEALGLGHVIARSILAVGIGSTLAFVIRAIADIIGSITIEGFLFANSFPGVGFGSGIPFYLGSSLQGAVTLFVTVLPLGVLAGILLWHWRKANPPSFHVEGLIDV